MPKKPPKREAVRLPRRETLARAIADELFAAGSGGKATRLEQKLLLHDGRERALGGWCYEAVVQAALRILEELT